MEASTDNFVLAQKDAAYIWHPYTQMRTSEPAIPIVSGKGCYLFGTDGKKYFDAISSWWVNLHGHAHPYIAEKISNQAFQLEHVIFANFTHTPAVELAERLVKLCGYEKGKVFFSDNGSTAVEAALKMAIQFWHNQSKSTQKTKIICFENGYHGDTFGAMSAAARSHFNRPFWPYLFKIQTIAPPYYGREEDSLQQLSSLIKNGDVACFIFEPILQGAAGMLKHSAQGLSSLLELCYQNQVITIADEVMTGFGRLGPLLACKYTSQIPDIVCLSKGITGGFLPLGATICKESIFEAFLSECLEHAFLHGHSYCANPIACAAALANLDLLELPQCSQQREMIALSHQRFCSSWQKHPRLSRCEATGTILVVEYKSPPSHHPSYFSHLRHKLVCHFLDHGILVRPIGNILYLLPPYCTSTEELENIYSSIIETLEKEL